MTQTPLDLEGLNQWIVERGLRGLTLEEHLSGFCERVVDAGFPMTRASMALGTLHPRYGAHSFIWRQKDRKIEHIPRERSQIGTEDYKSSPIHYMRQNQIEFYQCRLDKNETLAFPILNELREQGMTDYVARLVMYDPTTGQPGALNSHSEDGTPQVLNGVFFSCATDEPGGFDQDQLQQISSSLKFLALAIKSRLTHDVANTVLETYLGADASQRVLTGKIERGSVETIKAVIWLCDLRGFSAFADTVSRSELIETLDEYLEIMARPVHKNNGQILKFMGDGFLATFNLDDLDDEDVCQSALKAVAELRQEFDDFNAKRRQTGCQVMEFGLALHLGEVLYGNIGAIDRLDFTVVGPAVNEVSRIEALCRPLKRRVLISNSFYEAARQCHHVLVSMGEHELRGIREPQQLFSLIR